MGRKNLLLEELINMGMNEVITHSDKILIDEFDNGIKQMVHIRRVPNGWLYTIVSQLVIKGYDVINEIEKKIIFISENDINLKTTKPNDIKPFFGNENIALFNKENNSNDKGFQKFEEFKPIKSEQKEVNEPFQYIVEYKNNIGNYQAKLYTFNDERHFDNWYRKMENSGNKVIGWRTPTEEDLK